jgi:hypothetical protein
MSASACRSASNRAMTLGGWDSGNQNAQIKKTKPAAWPYMDDVKPLSGKDGVQLL